jgi:hypothetical protein
MAAAPDVGRMRREHAMRPGMQSALKKGGQRF